MVLACVAVVRLCMGDDSMLMWIVCYCIIVFCVSLFSAVDFCCQFPCLSDHLFDP